VGGARALKGGCVRHDGGVSSRRGLDPIDEAILRELAQDARRSYADIGAAVSLSAPAVKRRVDRLRDSGIIHAFTVELDHEALGWETEAYVEGFCSGSTSPETMRMAMETYPEVVSASTVTGEVDLLLHVRARDMRHLERVVERVNAEPFVVRTKSTIVLSALVRRAATVTQPGD